MNHMYRPPTLRGGQAPFGRGRKADIEPREQLEDKPKQTLEQRVAILERKVDELFEEIRKAHNDTINRQY